MDINKHLKREAIIMVAFPIAMMVMALLIAVFAGPVIHFMAQYREP